MRYRTWPCVCLSTVGRAARDTQPGPLSLCIAAPLNVFNTVDRPRPRPPGRKFLAADDDGGECERRSGTCCIEVCRPSSWVTRMNAGVASARYMSDAAIHGIYAGARIDVSLEITGARSQRVDQISGRLGCWSQKMSAHTCIGMMSKTKGGPRNTTKLLTIQLITFSIFLTVITITKALYPN